MQWTFLNEIVTVVLKPKKYHCFWKEKYNSSQKYMLKIQANSVAICTNVLHSTLTIGDWDTALMK